MALSIGDVEKDVARQRAEVDRLRHQAERFARGTQEHRAAVARLEAAETSLIADTKLLIFTRRRLAFFRALNAQDFMPPPLVTE